MFDSNPISSTQCPRFGYWTSQRVWRVEHGKGANHTMNYVDFYVEDGISVNVKTREKKHNTVIIISSSVNASTRIIVTSTTFCSNLNCKG